MQCPGHIQINDLLIRSIYNPNQRIIPAVLVQRRDPRHIALRITRQRSKHVVDLRRLLFERVRRGGQLLELLLDAG